MKTLQSSNFQEFRKHYRAKLEKIFIVPAKTFDNVNGEFPIGFKIWDASIEETFELCTAEIYDRSGLIGRRTFRPEYTFINRWYSTYYPKKGNLGLSPIGIMNTRGNDFQNTNYIRITTLDNRNHTNHITLENLIPSCIYLAVRHCIPATWINDRDQFASPLPTWETDQEFHSDCLAYTLFHGQNRISSQEGVNHWIPFTEKEVNAPTLFSSHFMTDFISGKLYIQGENVSNELFEHEAPQSLIPHEPMQFSPEAMAVFDAGRALWRHYFSQAGSESDPNVALYDIRLYFQGRDAKGKMNNDSPDTKYMELIGALRQALKILARKIEPKVYEHGFLPKLNTLS